MSSSTLKRFGDLHKANFEIERHAACLMHAMMAAHAGAQHASMLGSRARAHGAAAFFKLPCPPTTAPRYDRTEAGHG